MNKPINADGSIYIYNVDILYMCRRKESVLIPSHKNRNMPSRLAILFRLNIIFFYFIYSYDHNIRKGNIINYSYKIYLYSFKRLI